VRIEKIENSNLPQSGALLALAKLLRFSDSGLEAGPVRYCRHRRDPVPLVGRVKNGRLFRCPKTTNERRAHLSNNAMEEILQSYGVALKLRQKRKWHMLPDAYDDLSIRYERSWKEHRRAQCKNTRSINRQMHSPSFWDCSSNVLSFGSGTPS
jgi:hypothetical protein